MPKFQAMSLFFERTKSLMADLLVRKAKARAGEDVGGDDLADYGKREFVLEVDRNLDIIARYLGIVGCVVACESLAGAVYIHHRGVEAEAEHRNHELGLEACVHADAVVAVKEVFAHMQAVDIDAYAGTDGKLCHGGHHGCDAEQQYAETLD